MRGIRYALIAACWAVPSFAQDIGPLGLADYAAYRAALEPPRSEGEPARSATFRDLWDRPGEFQGRRVAVEGRVERVFHQGAVGQFPALAEVWIANTATDPLCVAFAESGESRAPKPGDTIRFEGTFLRKIRYQGGDVDRLAPLIVGPAPPRVNQPAPAPTPAPQAASGSPFEGVLLLIVGAGVLLMLLVGHLLRHTRTEVNLGPPPVFDDGTAASDNHRLRWINEEADGGLDRDSTNAVQFFLPDVITINPSPLVGEGRVGGSSLRSMPDPPPYPPPQGGRERERKSPGGNTLGD